MTNDAYSTNDALRLNPLATVVARVGRYCK